MRISQTLSSEKYPGLDDNEIKILESDTGGLSPTQLYNRMIKEKLSKEEKDKKTAAKNAALYEYTKNKDVIGMANVKKADVDDSIVELGRSNLKEKGIDDSDYSDSELIDMFKQNYGVNVYENILNGKDTIQDITNPNINLDGVVDTTIDVAKIISPLLLPLGGYAALRGIKAGISRIPTEGKFRNVVNYIKTNLLQGGKTAPEFVDGKVKNIVDYFSSLDGGVEKQINKNKLGKIRGLYNQVRDDLGTTISERTNMIKKNANKWVGEEILNPIKEEILKLGKVGQFDDYGKGLQDVYNETKKLIDENGGKILLEDAEKLKEIAYENVDFTKQSNVAVTAKEMNKAKGYRLLGKGVKEAMETVIPGIKEFNTIYGKLKDISKSIGLESVKLERMIPFTTLGNIRKTFGQIVQSIPGVSALGNLGGDLKQQRIDEKKLGKIITTSKRFSEKINKFIDKYGKVISEEAPETTKAVAKTEKTLRPGLKVLGKLGAAAGIAGVAQQFGPDPLAADESPNKNIPDKMVSTAQKLLSKYKGQKEIPEREIIRAGFMGNEIQAVKDEFKKRKTGVTPAKIEKGTTAIKKPLQQTAKTSLGF